MSQTLLIGTDPEQIKVYSLNLDIYVGTDVIIKNSLSEAFDLLKIHPGIDLIVAPVELNGEIIDGKLTKLLEELSRKIFLIVMGADQYSNENYITYMKDNSLKDLLRESAKALGVTARTMSEIQVGDYYPLSIDHFKNLDQACCDVFIRIVKSDGGDHYVKRFYRDEEIVSATLERYVRYGAKNLYVTSEDRFEFVDSYTKSLIDKFKNEDLGEEERVQSNEAAYNLVAQNIVEVEMSEELASLAEKSIESVQKVIKTFPKLNKLFQKLIANKAGYMYKRCQILTYVNSHIIDQIEWGSKEQKNKLAFVSFFQDITIGETKYAKIRNDEQLNELKASDKKKEEIKKHAQDAALLLQNFPHAPMEATSIIKEHHGLKNGYGYSEIMASNLARLSIVYNIADEFTYYLMEEYKDGINLEKIVTRVQRRFPKLKHRQIVDTLWNIEV